MRRDIAGRVGQGSPHDRPVLLRQRRARTRPQDRRGRPDGRGRLTGRRDPRRRAPGTTGAPTWPSAPGARCARTIPPTATPGTSSPTSTPASAPTAGTGTAWPACRICGRTCVCRWPCGTAATNTLRGADVRTVRPQGNHGEDAKEYWWYTDATPSHAWLSWRYHYPQAAYPTRTCSRPTSSAPHGTGVRTVTRGSSPTTATGP